VWTRDAAPRSLTPRRSRWAFGPLIALLLGLLPALPARAQAPPSSAETDATFSRGLSLFDAKDYAGAAAVWEGLLASVGEAKGWKVFYNLGLAYEAALDATRAIERYDAFLRAVEREPMPLPAALEDRKQDAADRSRALKATHGAVRVHSPASGERVMVRVDDTPPRAAPFTAYARPGPLLVEVGVGGPRPRRVDVNLAAGITSDVDATESPIAPPPPPSTHGTAPPPPPPSSFPTVWVVTGAGLTAASIALPIALNARAASKREDAEKLGVGHTDYAAARDEFDSARTLYYASYAVPALLGAVTVAIAIVGAVKQGPTTAVSVGARTERGGVSFVGAGRF